MCDKSICNNSNFLSLKSTCFMTTLFKMKSVAEFINPIGFLINNLLQEVSIPNNFFASADHMMCKIDTISIFPGKTLLYRCLLNNKKSALCKSQKNSLTK